MKDYFLNNFPLLCILISMGFISIRNFSIRRRTSIYFLFIIGTIFVLSIITSLMTYFQTDSQYIFLATFVTVLGYIIRPVCIYYFLRLADHKNIFKYYWVFFIVLGINALVYIPALFINVDFLKNLTFYYAIDEATNGLVHVRSYLNFFAHIVSFIMLAVLIYVCVRRIRSRHITEATVIIICSLFVVASVIIEALNLKYDILNITVAISSVFYYLFLGDQANRKDALTDVANRQTYFIDVKRFEKQINALMVIDMNGLKFINDTYGHDAGDKALVTIGRTLQEKIPTSMSGYRVGGDEFIVLGFNIKEEKLEAVSKLIKSECEKDNCFVSIGYAFKKDKNITLDDLSKIADERMYQDKTEFYKNNRKFERRHQRKEE